MIAANYGLVSGLSEMMADGGCVDEIKCTRLSCAIQKNTEMLLNDRPSIQIGGFDDLCSVTIRILGVVISQAHLLHDPGWWVFQNLSREKTLIICIIWLYQCLLNVPIYFQIRPFLSSNSALQSYWFRHCYTVLPRIHHGDLQWIQYLCHTAINYGWYPNNRIHVMTALHLE